MVSSTGRYVNLLQHCIATHSPRLLCPQICTPIINSSQHMSPAARAQHQELQRSAIEGCTSYSRADLAQMECSEFDAHPGDIIYMPKGLPHVARASESGPSVHLTLGFKRDHVRWVDLAADAIKYQALAHTSSAVAGDVVDMVDGLVRNSALSLPIWLYDAVPLGQAQQAQGTAELLPALVAR